MKVGKLVLPDFEDYIPSLNLDAIAMAFLAVREGETPLSKDDWLNAKEMLWAAATHWLPRDMHDLKIEGVEDERFLELPFTELPIRMFVDLHGVTGGAIKPFDAFAGQKIAFDWKTRYGELSTDWKDRQVDSWQWRIYARTLGASLFVYRGVSRKCPGGVCDTREVIIKVPETNTAEVDEYLRGALASRKALVDAKLPVWPRSMPSACNAYGRECPFKYDCDTYSMPRFEIQDRAMSYTQLSRYFLCPEKHRRLINAPHDDDSEETNFGQAWHRGAAELYQQARLIKL